jgi:putative ubiquitin-RnfH superfamily antitoxin RatB of RatAB toxin-antitoxin module
MISAGQLTEVTTETVPEIVRVEVVFALPERYWSVHLELAGGATVAEALTLSGIESLVPSMEIDPARLAIFSRPAQMSTRLHDGDRLEILRPLLADPKQSRRERAVVASPRKR